jgi:predicted DNA-binding ribbon-helix-helix protein
MRLEPEVWEALKEICSAENITVGDLVSRAEANYEGGRTSAVRVYILEHYRSAVHNVARIQERNTVGEFDNNSVGNVL